MPTTPKYDHSEETVRLLAALVRLQTDSQAQAIIELHKSGFGASRAAELLGTSAGTAKVAIQRSKKPAKKAKKPTRKVKVG